MTGRPAPFVQEPNRLSIMTSRRLWAVIGTWANETKRPEFVRTIEPSGRPIRQVTKSGTLRAVLWCQDGPYPRLQTIASQGRRP